MTGLSAEQLVARTQGLGGSDMGAVLGLSPYRTPLDVYMDKTGQVEPADLSNNQAVHFGIVLEDVVAAEFARRTGLKVRRNNQHLVHPEHEFLMGNIDRAVVGKPFGLKCGLECKTSDKWAAKPELWGPGSAFETNADGELVLVTSDDQVPDWYHMQCDHYMAVTGCDMWFLAVLIGGNDFRIYTIFRDMDLENMLIKHASNFWYNHVIKEVPPAPSNVVDMETLYAVDSGESVDASQEIIDTWAELKELSAQRKALDARIDGQTIGKTKIGGLKNKIRMAIGPHSQILLGEEGKPLATWKAPKAGRKVFDTEALERDHPEIIKKYTKKIPGSRTLLIK